MRAFVSGAAGFIGSHLVEELLARGWDVVGVDNLVTGRHDNLKAVLTHERFRFIDHELADSTFFGVSRCDVIFHLAGHVGVRHVLEDIQGVLMEHVTHAVLVADWARRWDARLIVTSTSELYGGQATTSRAEEDCLVIGPSHIARSAYAASKLWLEHWILEGVRSERIQAVIARLFNIAGPRQRPDNVIGRWVHAALQGEAIVVHGEGECLRSFLHVADCVNALIALAQCDEALGLIVNVGQPTAHAMRAVADLVRSHCYAATGMLAPIFFQDWADVDPQSGWQFLVERSPDVRRLTALTGLTFEERLGDIIADTVAEARTRQ